MAKAAYTILLEKGPKHTVRVTVPSLPGFEFRARNRKNAYTGSAGRIEHFLKRLARRGKTIPKEPAEFWITPDLIQVNLPKARESSNPKE